MQPKLTEFRGDLSQLVKNIWSIKMAESLDSLAGREFTRGEFLKFGAAAEYVNDFETPGLRN